MVTLSEMIILRYSSPYGFFMRPIYWWGGTKREVKSNKELEKLNYQSMKMREVSSKVKKRKKEKKYFV